MGNLISLIIGILSKLAIPVGMFLFGKMLSDKNNQLTELKKVTKAQADAETTATAMQDAYRNGANSKDEVVEKLTEGCF